MGIGQRYDRIEEPGRMLSFDDHTVDHISVVNPDTGLVEQRPIAVTPEEAREVEIASMRHGLASVEHRLTIIDERFPNQEPPTAEQIERKRQGLENERAFCLAELERLEAPDPTPDADEPTEPTEPTKKGRRR